MKIVYITVLLVLIACQSDLEIGQAVDDDPCTYDDLSMVRTIHGVRTVEGSITEEYRQEIIENETGRRTITFDEDGNPAVEQYLVGANSYIRELNSSVGQWGAWVSMQAASLTQEQMDKDSTSMGENPISVFCGVQDIVDHKYLGEDTLDGLKVRRFSSTWPDDFLGGGDLSVDFEFWVDSSGRLHQLRWLTSTSLSQTWLLLGLPITENLSR